MEPDPENTKVIRMISADRIKSTMFVRDFTVDLLRDAEGLDWRWYRRYLYSTLETEAN